MNRAHLYGVQIPVLALIHVQTRPVFLSPRTSSARTQVRLEAAAETGDPAADHPVVPALASSTHPNAKSRSNSTWAPAVDLADVADVSPGGFPMFMAIWHSVSRAVRGAAHTKRVQACQSAWGCGCPPDP